MFDALLRVDPTARVAVGDPDHHGLVRLAGKNGSVLYLRPDGKTR
ncbi:hypothetical protein GCM10010252_00050 [Streptomyces aureoverticillatus]|nr:hypothetical protein GCM10010252_00050 [Streptomyces aureoverticillatus]